MSGSHMFQQSSSSLPNLNSFSRYLAGQKEYEVELQFSSVMLGFLDRLRNDVPAVDGNSALIQS